MILAILGRISTIWSVGISMYESDLTFRTPEMKIFRLKSQVKS